MPCWTILPKDRVKVKVVGVDKSPAMSAEVLLTKSPVEGRLAWAILSWDSMDRSKAHQQVKPQPSNKPKVLHKALNQPVIQFQQATSTRMTLELQSRTKSHPVKAQLTLFSATLPEI